MLVYYHFNLCMNVCKYVGGLHVFACLFVRSLVVCMYVSMCVIVDVLPLI